MTTNTAKLAAALETLSSQAPMHGISNVVPYLAELAGAKQISTVIFEVNSIKGASQVNNLTVVTGTLSNDLLERMFYSQPKWWADQFLCPAPSPAGFLIQAKDGMISEAFRFASEPLMHPKLSVIFMTMNIGQKAMAAIVASDIDDVPCLVDLTIFQTLATSVLQKYAQNRAQKASVLVTDRERECLLWSARGKTSLDIAEITSLSEHTVNHYLTNAATKLNASNRVSAIIRSITLGVIPIIEI